MFDGSRPRARLEDEVDTMQKAIGEAEFASRMNMSVRLFRKMARESGIPTPMNPMTNYRNWVWSENAVTQYISGTYKGPVGAPPAAPKPGTTAGEPAPKRRRGRPPAQKAAAGEGDEEASFTVPSDFVIEPLPDGSIKISIRK